MKKIFEEKLQLQTQDIFGAFTLSDTVNIKQFASHAFAGLIQKICFHTGILEKDLLELMGKTLIQAELKSDGFATIVWSLHFDKALEAPEQITEPSTPLPQEVNLPKKKSHQTKKHVGVKEKKIGPVFHIQEETLQLEEGFLFSIKFRPGDEFLIIMPITGEKIKTVIRRKTNCKMIDGIFYEQTSQFPNGKVEAIYTKTEQGGMKVSLHHVASHTKAEVTFKKAFAE